VGLHLELVGQLADLRRRMAAMAAKGLQEREFAFLIKGESMRLARSRPSQVRALLLVTVVLGLVFAYVLPAAASHPEVSLAGSNFEIDTDANRKVDDPAPSIDWAGVDEIRKADTPSGSTDESFGQGTKEDTAVPTVVDGSIPPNTAT
jgi:hypothetical protein